MCALLALTASLCCPRGTARSYENYVEVAQQNILQAMATPELDCSTREVRATPGCHVRGGRHQWRCWCGGGVPRTHVTVAQTAGRLLSMQVSVIVRINQVSRSHQKQRFRVRLALADLPSGCPPITVISATTTPVRVLSKLSTRNRARAAAAKKQRCVFPGLPASGWVSASGRRVK